MSAALELLVDALAAYRLTRLVTEDTITEGLRREIVAAAYVYDGEEERGWEGTQQPVSEYVAEHRMDAGPMAVPKLADLVTCRWCAGVWVALGVVAARRVAPRAWAPLARALAFSSAAALVAGLED